MATVNKDFKVKNNISIVNTADTATAASHYIVETGTDGVIRPKTLANVKTEIVTTAAVNAAAATTVGTITSGVWNAGAVTSSGAIQGTILTSTIATGTAPLTVASTTKVTNLNADLFDGIDSDKFVYGTTQAGSRTANATQDFTEMAQWKSGFWDVSNGAWAPTATGWYWGLTMAHTSGGPAYLYGAQFAIANGDPTAFYVRTTSGGPTPTATAWSKVAFLASPAFTGTPTAPTATAGTNTTQIATTAFVTSALSGVTGGASYQTTAPTTPSVGQIWVDSDETVTSLNSNDFLLKSGGTMTGNLVVSGTTTLGTATITTLNATTINGPATVDTLTVSTKLITEEIMTIAISDETTSITTGTAKITFRAPFAMTLTKAPRASLSAASTSGNPAIDINKNGVSIFSTTLTIDANEKTSTTAATAAVLSTTTFSDDDEITVDVDTAGTGAKGLKITLYYKRT